MRTVIKSEDLGKMYQLRMSSGHRYKTLREEVSSGVKSLISGKRKSNVEEFWALRNISFDIKQGDRIGIIGRNGAGKSTLLKILSRITDPTEGRISIKGRVASLLEVGTGFHPELSGRENIFLNGSILGMSRDEIRGRFDEIVAFAEVERFLETPIKRYSSGMYVRLAFAVAAHLEPEILIVDEVLAVGDAQFQQKCLGKMEEVSKNEGRTVLFVSHNMATIQYLCNQCIYLKQGKFSASGNTQDVISKYLQESTQTGAADLANNKHREGNQRLRFTSVSFSDTSGKEIRSLQCGDDVTINLHLVVAGDKPLSSVHFSVGIDDQLGQRITYFSNEITNQLFNKVDSSNYIVRIEIKKLPLKQGNYSYTLFSTVGGEIADWVKNAGSFFVEAGDFFRTGKLPDSGPGNFLYSTFFQLGKGMIRNLITYLRQTRRIIKSGHKLESSNVLLKDFPQWQKLSAPGTSSVKTGIPWMTFSAIRFMEKNLDRSMSVFEYGCGGSTLFLCERVGKVISIEHDTEWFKILSNKIKELKISNWVGKLVEPEFAGINTKEIADPDEYGTDDLKLSRYRFRNYASAIDEFANGEFDWVLIDGRARPSCLKHAIPKVKKGGFLLLDNSDRDYYLQNLPDDFSQRFKIVRDNAGPAPFMTEFSKTTIWQKIN